jgi:hypothetical protein
MKDQFGLDRTMNEAGKKRLAQQPTTRNNVPCGHTVRSNQPSASKTVKGMPKKLK